jgi:predicted phage gp36 major capsid-like protein
VTDFYAIKDFDYEGESYYRGRTIVSAEDAAFRAHPDRFVSADEFRAAARDMVRSRAGDSRHQEPTSEPERRSAPVGPAGSVEEVRSAALRTIEYHSDHLSARAGDRLTLIAERDASGATASYLSAVGDPHYRSAFLKRLANPDPGPGQLLSPQEAEAMQRVHEIEGLRSMSLGEGKLGGFAVPFELDPTIMLTTAGATNPLREVARTVTVVSSNVWKGISSEGVEASFDAEEAEVSDDIEAAGIAWDIADILCSVSRKC